MVRHCEGRMKEGIDVERGKEGSMEGGRERGEEGIEGGEGWRE